MLMKMLDRAFRSSKHTLLTF